MKKRRRRKNRTGYGIIAFVVLLLFAVLSYNRVGLAHELDENIKTEARLDEQIQEQKERAQDIKERITYVQSREYIEEIARKKLGLVYKDEIIFEKKEK